MKKCQDCDGDDFVSRSWRYGLFLCIECYNERCEMESYADRFKCDEMEVE